MLVWFLASEVCKSIDLLLRTIYRVESESRLNLSVKVRHQVASCGNILLCRSQIVNQVGKFANNTHTQFGVVNQLLYLLQTRDTVEWNLQVADFSLRGIGGELVVKTFECRSFQAQMMQQFLAKHFLPRQW